MKKELSKIQKIQNVLFILLNSILVLLGFCFIAIKIEDYELLVEIVFSLYCLLCWYFCSNLKDFSHIEKQKIFEELKKYYDKKEN